MSIKDVIKGSVLSQFKELNMNEGTVTTIIVSLLVSLLLGIAICLIYKRLFVYREGIYSSTFCKTLVGMTVLTCMVTLAISTNIVISLGMVGSLSIVRYRTAIKDPMDLLYLFWAITSGITIGAGMNSLCLAGFIVVTIYLIVSNRIPINKHDYVLAIRIKKEEYKKEELEKTLSPYRYVLKTRITHGNELEMTYSVRRIKQEQMTLLDNALYSLKGVTDVAIIDYNGEYNE